MVSKIERGCKYTGPPRGLGGPRANIKIGPIIQIVLGLEAGILHALGSVLEISEVCFSCMHTVHTLRFLPLVVSDKCMTYIYMGP